MEGNGSLSGNYAASFERGADWGEPHSWQWQGYRCHWRVLGENNQRPLVFVHGFGASSAHWRNNAHAFACAGFHVYGIDLIGFGQSEQPGSNLCGQLDNKLWAKQLASFLEEVVEVHLHGKAVLVGNSLGALAALTTINLREDLVAALVAAPLPDPAFMGTYRFPKNKLLRRLRYCVVNISCNLLPLELIVPLIANTPLINFALQSAYHRSIKFDYELQKLVAKPARRLTASRSLRAMCIGMTLRSQDITAPAMLEKLDINTRRPPVLLLWGGAR